MRNNHLIGKQVFELGLGTSDNSYVLQQQISDFANQVLMPRLVSLFDRMVPESKVVQIDQIELHLGTIHINEVNSGELANKIIQELEIEFSKIKNFKSIETAVQNTDSESNQYLTLGQKYFQSWLYWLEKGTLPPHTLAPEEGWLELVIETLALDHKAITQLKKTLKRYPQALERLVLQHRAKDLKSITELYTGHSQRKLLVLFAEIKGFISRALELQLWKLVFKNVILERKKLNSTSLGLQIIANPEIQRLENKTQVKLKSSEKYPVFKELLKLHTKEGENTDTEEIERPEHLKDLDMKTMVSPQFFKNAGIVLLHPFLKRLFEKLKLLKGAEFKNHKCRCKGVLLIHFLATGTEIVPEYEMVLPKFLCEMPPNVPLDHTLRISKKEKEQATNLLLAVIDHWGALGNTSPEGLQEGFLIREGKLVKEQAGWKLVVSQNASDLLLDKLPWNLSMVKLPWMKELLKVEWR